ncbi:MAG: hypothetical protein COU46_03315 [Candidatus Niyogibacteria bacterium CG10_big_fil_rev_8_21_14_0_10_42_19]|uniref:Ada DNA repair metal-binding domain-containing protein n=1 Tax=Candidatus Niyogibacteria bacterium CG10_big_fil_rev_8_21_14_0_10_42_19 TaxID=1974725 RepID=A0A2H0TGH7_9BACT|nr:MAG: hypothetical protein COU46_03315 [Candidatus Niyogibacteria bacterium CG10_big_fil_rev_8_21_14_0_10_42_19]
MEKKQTSRLELAVKWIKENKNDLILAVSFFLIAVISFGLGRLSIIMGPKEPLGMEYSIKTDEYTNTDKNDEIRGTGVLNTGGVIIGNYVGSKNSDKYHLPDCPGALRIKEENKIWFSSIQEAESLGYTPAGNCDGI